MRLIDADALWEKVENAEWEVNADRDMVEDLIVNAPNAGGFDVRMETEKDKMEREAFEQFMKKIEAAKKISGMEVKRVVV
ncbi:MAG: hypothetical protein LUE22_01595 [Oscillospiraceae bacterium]|nr:hypothetical protein [Oscillospiraceae bacterium]